MPHSGGVLATTLRVALLFTSFAVASRWLMHPSCSMLYHPTTTDACVGMPAAHPFLDVACVVDPQQHLPAWTGNSTHCPKLHDPLLRPHEDVPHALPRRMLATAILRDEDACGACCGTVFAEYDMQTSSVLFGMAWHGGPSTNAVYRATPTLLTTLQLATNPGRQHWPAALVYCEPKVDGRDVCVVQFVGMLDASDAVNRNATADGFVLADLLEITCGRVDRSGARYTSARLLAPTDLPLLLQRAVSAVVAKTTVVPDTPTLPQRALRLAAARSLPDATLFYFVRPVDGGGWVVRVGSTAATVVVDVPCLSCTASASRPHSHHDSGGVSVAMFVGHKLVYRTPHYSDGAVPTTPHQRCEVVVLADLEWRIAAHVALCPQPVVGVGSLWQPPRVDVTPFTVTMDDATRRLLGLRLKAARIAACIFGADVVVSDGGGRRVALAFHGLVLTLPMQDTPERFSVLTAVATDADVQLVSWHHNAAVHLWHDCVVWPDRIGDVGAHRGAVAVNAAGVFVCRCATSKHHIFRIAPRTQVLSMTTTDGTSPSSIAAPSSQGAGEGRATVLPVDVVRCIDYCCALFEASTGMSLGVWLTIGALLHPWL